MSRLFPRTLFAQLVLGTVLVQGLFLGVFITFVVVWQGDAAKQRNHDRIAGQLNRLSAACAKQLERGDNGALNEVLEMAEIATTIQATRLTDLWGKTLAVSQRGRDEGLDPYEAKVLPTATRQQIFTIRNGQLEAVTPVLLDGKPVALLWLEPNASASLSSASMIVHIALTYGAAALLMNLLPIFLIVRSMTRPLSVLTEATQRVIREPDTSERFPLPITTNNEAGALTLSFNTMVSELQEQRRGLMQTLALLDSMLENAPIGFAFFDADLRYVRVNRFLLTHRDMAERESLGRSVSEVFPEPAAHAFAENLQRVFDSGEAVRDVEITNALTNEPAENRTWLMNFYPVRTVGEAVRWVGAVGVEITDRLRTEAALLKTEKLAAAGRLASSVSHEINNPLEAVTNLLYILEQYQPMDADALLFIRSAQAELARVAHITQQTLRFYRQSASRSRVDLGEMLDSIVLLYQPRMNSAGITVTRHYRGDPGLIGFGGELRQMFANLIVNAVEAMPYGGHLALRARISRCHRADGSTPRGVSICVADSGAGMTPAVRKKIFEAFFTTKHATGTGLGLWVSDEIIRNHGGTVRVKSREGCGTCFRIFLPLRETTTASV